MKPYVPLVACVLFLTACSSTWNNSTKITSGMTKAELVAAIGQPEDSMSPGAGVEVLRYIFVKQRTVRIPPAVPLKKEYLVRLVNDRVEAYGTPRELAKAAPYVTPKNEKTININVRTDGQTNTVAPIEPRLNLNEN